MNKLWLLFLVISAAFGQLKELTDENFDKATKRGLVVVEFWATWNETNKVVVFDEWDTFDAKVYRINIELYPAIQTDNEVVVLPTIIFYDEGEEVERLQGDLTFTLDISTKKLDKMVDEILMSKF